MQTFYKERGILKAVVLAQKLRALGWGFLPEQIVPLGRNNWLLYSNCFSQFTIHIYELLKLIMKSSSLMSDRQLYSSNKKVHGSVGDKLLIVQTA